ncbi:hypothetical protein AB0M43_37520 [Longispora sp. NPDC051575]|uniref:hypothetical protein n=1 Tax=Longispora sp. NPDC051575 TaxID=3154943 RepID=UPI00342C4862
MTGTNGGVNLDPVAVAALLGRLGGLDSVVAGSRVVDERTGRKQRQFDSEARQFAASSGLASALELARRCGSGIKDAHIVVQALDTEFTSLISKATTAMRTTGGTDIAAADSVERSGEVW